MVEQKQLTDGTECTEQTERIKNSHSETTRLAKRDTRTGMFLKRTKANPTPARIASAITAKLTQSEDGEDSTLEKIVDSMADLAQDYTEKTASAAVKAAELLMKVVGLPEKQAEQKASITVNIMPIELMHPEVIDGDTPKPKLKPSWLEAEIVTNPALPPASPEES